MRATSLASLVAVATLAACADANRATAPAPRPLDVPRQVATCPDPAQRQQLDEGSTYRDALPSRNAAIDGWERCHNAAAENAR